MTKRAISPTIERIADKAFKVMLNNGAFPKVGWSYSRGFTTYNMMDYSITWSKFMMVLDHDIKVFLQEPEGVFTRKRSDKFLAGLEKLFKEITEERVESQTQRFATWCD